MSELDALPLQAALIGGYLAARAERAVPSLPALPGLPTLGISGLLGHAVSYMRGSAGLWVPARPALIGRASPIAATPSGRIGSRTRAPVWDEVLDLDGLAAFLRREHPAKTAVHVSALTGESVETVRKWLRLETKPGMRATLVLVCVYGLPLVEACLRSRPEWLVEAADNRSRHALAREVLALGPRLDAAFGLAA